MRLSTIQKLGGVSLILGSVLLLLYSILFPLLLPISIIRTDLTPVVLHPAWRSLAIVAFIAVILLMFGFAAVYSRIVAGSGVLGLLGFIFIEFAYLIQACSVTWEILIWPIIAAHQNSLFLLKDFVIKQDPSVVMFRIAGSATIFVGIILFCTALVRSGRFPKLGGILIFAGAFLYGLGPLVSLIVAIAGIFIFSIGCTMIGVSTIKNQAT